MMLSRERALLRVLQDSERCLSVVEVCERARNAYGLNIGSKSAAKLINGLDGVAWVEKSVGRRTRCYYLEYLLLPVGPRGLLQVSKSWVGARVAVFPVGDGLLPLPGSPSQRVEAGGVVRLPTGWSGARVQVFRVFPPGGNGQT